MVILDLYKKNMSTWYQVLSLAYELWRARRQKNRFVTIIKCVLDFVHLFTSVQMVRDRGNKLNTMHDSFAFVCKYLSNYSSPAAAAQSPLQFVSFR